MVCSLSITQKRKHVLKIALDRIKINDFYNDIIFLLVFNVILLIYLLSDSLNDSAVGTEMQSHPLGIFFFFLEKN